MTFNGLLPGVPEAALGLPLLDLRELGNDDSMQRVINSPSGIQYFFPTPTPKKVTLRPATPFPATPVPPTPAPPTPPPTSPPPFSPGPVNGL